MNFLHASTSLFLYFQAWFEEKKLEITEKRTTAQIRRCLKSWMIAPSKEKLYEYRLKSLGWNDTNSVDRNKNKSSEVIGTNPTSILYLFDIIY